MNTHGLDTGDKEPIQKEPCYDCFTDGRYGF